MSGLLVLILLGGVPLIPAGLADSGEKPTVRARYLMGTRCEVRAYGARAETGAAIEAALDRIAELDDTLTTYRANGELAQVNRLAAERRSAGEPSTRHIHASADLVRAVREALAWSRRTGGLFDPAIGALAEVWGLKTGGRRPEPQQIAAALARSSSRWVETETGGIIVRRPGVELDLGGFGKGFALDEAAQVLRHAGVSRALLDFGGQILALGPPPGRAGWLIEIADPANRLRPVAALELSDRSVATSGAAERSFRVNGQTFNHILDPRDGLPVPFDGSVTVIAPRAADADALATAIVVARGADRAVNVPEGIELLILERSPQHGSELRARATPELRARLQPSLGSSSRGAPFIRTIERVSRSVGGEQAR